MANDLYIGCPNGIVLCVDELNQMGCSGRFYHSYQKEAVSFGILGEMLFRMEGFFDSLNFPRRGNTDRNFMEPHTAKNGQQKERERIMADKEVLGHKGQQETFIVRVQHRQNNTWQGRITWADKDKTLTFRSIWEMVHLMENALFEGASPDEIPDFQSWEEKGDQEE